MKEPYRRILENAGLQREEIDKIEQKLAKCHEGAVYDALNHKIVDSFEQGILDPVKVTLAALENAVSIAKMIMTLGGAVTIPRDKALEEKLEMEASGFAQQMGQ